MCPSEVGGHGTPSSALGPLALNDRTPAWWQQCRPSGLLVQAPHSGSICLKAWEMPGGPPINSRALHHSFTQSRARAEPWRRSPR